MRESEKQAQATDRLLSVLNACASTVDVLWLRQTAGEENRLFSRWRLLGKICPPPTPAHKTVSNKHCTHAQAQGHIHTWFTGQHTRALHTAWDTNPGQTHFLALHAESHQIVFCHWLQHWRKSPRECSNKAFFITKLQNVSSYIIATNSVSLKGMYIWTELTLVNAFNMQWKKNICNIFCTCLNFLI